MGTGIICGTIAVLGACVVVLFLIFWDDDEPDDTYVTGEDHRG